MRSIFLILFLTVILNSCYLILNTRFAHAEHMTSPNYKLEQTNLNMTSGKKSSSNYTITDTVGQTAPGRYTSSGFLVLAGFQYYYSIIPFRFAISKTAINFGVLLPDTPVTDTDPAVLTVSVGGAGGYKVTAIEDDQLRKSVSVYIPDTTCQVAVPCDVDDASAWTGSTIYGFGYNMNGTDVPVTFVDTTYFRPFPSNGDGGSAATVMTGPNVGRDKQATITFKVNISNLQEAGLYQNIINFVATPTY